MNVIQLEDGTYWKLVKTWKIFGKWNAELWVRYRDSEPIEAVKIIETNKTVSSIPIPIPKYVKRQKHE